MYVTALDIMCRCMIHSIYWQTELHNADIGLFKQPRMIRTGLNKYHDDNFL